MQRKLLLFGVVLGSHLLPALTPHACLSAAEAPTVNFRQEVMAVLSRGGCNQGPCHGNLNGKGGFKLSLRGENPAFDWAALTTSQMGRRVNLMAPEQSLVLQKASARVPHEGGQRFPA